MDNVEAVSAAEISRVMRAMRARVAPERCARSSKLMRAAANKRWRAVRAAKIAEMAKKELSQAVSQ